MTRLILLRHGQSLWNKLNLFTGWVDIPLTYQGVQESLEAGKRIAHMPIDIIYTSTLVRAMMTGMLAMSEHKSGKVPVVEHKPTEGTLASWGKIYDPEVEKNIIPVITAWELNERMYGELQGLNKQDMMHKFGEDQVKLWRRSYDIAPPEGESLEMTADRTIPYFKEKILPQLNHGKNVLISAHGNSLRAIVMFLENLSKDEVLHLEIATGDPLVYRKSEGKWERVHGH